jgi:peptidoglycan/LPS O-acetylase OafA/YrhL
MSTIQSGLTEPGSVVATDPARRYDLDWLRLVGTLGVFLFHAARLFDDDDWHLKNDRLDLAIAFWAGFLDLWIMPLMFLLSGMSIALALRHRSGGRFARERVSRLLVPLLFGIAVLAPPQVYVERITRGQFAGSFLAFLPRYVNAPYLGVGGTGNFAWMGLHLWYLLVLFSFSLLLLPLFLTLRGPRWQAAAAHVDAWLATPGAIFLPAIPLMLLSGGLDPATLGRRDFGGWNLFVYLLLLLYGFVLAATPGFGAAAHRARLGTSLLGLVAGFVAGWFGDAGFAARGLAMWCLLLLLFGLFHPLRATHTALLGYAGELVLPFYLLHQPAIVLIGYAIVQVALPPWVEYGLIVALCLPLVIAVYEFVVRRFTPVRLLFGLKPLGAIPRLRQRTAQ